MAQGGSENQTGGRQKRRSTKSLPVALLLSTIVHLPLHKAELQGLYRRIVLDGSRWGGKVMAIEGSRGVVGLTNLCPNWIEN